jgi:ribose 5-phosphate isomerase A
MAEQPMDLQARKQAAAEAALELLAPAAGAGHDHRSRHRLHRQLFIDALARLRGAFDGTVASSEASAERLRSHGIPVYDLNSVNRITLTSMAPTMPTMRCS